MTTAEIAKNLLEGKFCANCQHHGYGRCYVLKTNPQVVSEGVALPEGNTCKHWEKEWEMKITSTQVTAKARKLNIKWSVESELEMEPISIDVEEELIKAAIEEINEEKT